ncbi:hypothetical protein G7Z17_g1919 [Cylindrodendrum hubeiense]|uniref:Serine protease n=1 Tax=Cylindrodendrum hubeiense TaxID=595255 RepID=A0A9P5HHP3_9HYPO|nr:hypothetical protein G7Z17_g1919 [Cylindrodendrum hubeiense]
MSAIAATKPGRAAAWKLDLPATSHPAESTILPDDGCKKDEESIIGEDERALVDLGDLREGGKYRSIVKIQARFDNKTTGKPVWMMGTGWLIRPDLIITAGHVVYDWGHRFGAASQIKCYIGYNGRASVTTSQVQARYGLNVVSTAEWIETPDNRMRDVAFIQVDRPFTGNLRTFNYVETPTSGNNTLLGVVGYPGDKYFKDANGGSDEYGAQMYEEFGKTEYNLETNARHMIGYQVSTYGGQSGAPILRRADGQLTSIGTHCYGGGGSDSNSGNAIGGAYGNNYETFIGLFNGGQYTFAPGKVEIVDTQARANQRITETTTRITDSSAKFTDNSHTASRFTDIASRFSDNTSRFTDNSHGTSRFSDSMTRIPAQASTTRITNSTTRYPVQSSPPRFNGYTTRTTPSNTRFPVVPTGTEEEGFFDILKTVARVGSRVLPVASPLLGPIGGYLGTAAGALLGSLGAESITDGNAENGSAERAMLAESALQAVLSMEHSEDLEEVVTKMQGIWATSAPNINALAPVLAPALTECALDLTSDRWARAADPTRPRGEESTIVMQRRDLGITLTESGLGGGEEAAFVEGLFGPTRQLAGEEGIFDWLGPVLRTAVSHVTPIVSQAAKSAISGLGNTLLNKAKNALGAESAMSDGLSSNEEATRILLKRAVMADAALQALMTLPRAKLQRLKLTHEESGETEGIFDFMKTTVQKFGPIALDSAKNMAKKYLPGLIDTATKKISGHLGLSAEAGFPDRTIARKPSFRDMLNGNGNSIKVSYVEDTPVGLTTIDVNPLINARKEAWVPSIEWQKSWDDNDDGPVIMSEPPADF